MNGLAVLMAIILNGQKKIYAKVIVWSISEKVFVGQTKRRP
jgi:hypothetical protein